MLGYQGLCQKTVCREKYVNMLERETWKCIFYAYKCVNMHFLYMFLSMFSVCSTFVVSFHIFNYWNHVFVICIARML